MKKSILIFLFIISAITLKARPQSPGDEQQAIAMLRTFYTAYMTEMAGSDPNFDKVLYALQKKYCTQHLLQNIAKRNDPNKSNWLESDPLIKAQDCSIDFVKTLSFTRNPRQPNLYTVSYYYIDDTTKKKETTVINLFVTKEKDGLKISSLYADYDSGYRDRL